MSAHRQVLPVGRPSFSVPYLGRLHMASHALPAVSPFAPLDPWLLLGCTDWRVIRCRPPPPPAGARVVGWPPLQDGAAPTSPFPSLPALLALAQGLLSLLAGAPCRPGPSLCTPAWASIYVFD